MLTNRAPVHPAAGLRARAADNTPESAENATIRPAARPLHVLVVNHGGVLGGAESWLLSALESTARLEAHAVLLADGPLRAALRTRGVAVTVHPVGRRIADVARAAVRMRAHLARLDPDVVVANGVKAAAVAVPAARLTGVPSVWVKHDHSHDRWLARPLALAADRVVATAAEVAVAAGRPDTVVIEPPRPPGPLPRDAATAALAALGAPTGDRLRLVMLSRYVPYKGVDTAVRALARPEAAGWDLIVLGPDEPTRPDERARLRALAAELGVGDRVHLGPYVSGAARLLSAADAVAVLTRPDGPRTPGREGFGIAALEAMLAGVPVLAVADGGPVGRRIGPDAAGRAAGVTVEPGDATAGAVADALGRLADPALRRRLGAEGRRRAAGHPDATAVAGRFAAVLAEVARRPGAGLTGGPPLSVVSPVLNEADVLDRLVATVAAQLGPDDEYVLVDGGSTDGTVELLTAWRRRDPRVRLVHSAGGTIARSRNVGVTAARHAFIACTDAGCDPAPGWLAGFRAAAAETAATRAAARAEGPAAARPEGPAADRATGTAAAVAATAADGTAGPAAGRRPELYVGVYRAAIRPGRPFEQAMAAVSWPDPDELRRPTPWRIAYGRLFGRAFSARRVDGRSVAFTRDAWAAAGGFPEHLRTAEDEAFGRAVLAAGARSALTLDAEVRWHQRPTVAATFRQFRGYGRGGGASRSPLLLGRDLARVAGYAALALLVGWGGPGGWAAALAGAAAYLSLPVARVLRRRQSPLVLPLLPAALLLKDTAKVLGTAEALLAGLRRPAAPRDPVAGRSAGDRPAALAGLTALAGTGVLAGFVLAAAGGPAGPAGVLGVAALVAGVTAVLARPLAACALVFLAAAVANRAGPGFPLGLQIVHAVCVLAVAAVLAGVAAGAPTDRLRHPRLRLPLLGAAAVAFVAVLSSTGSVTPEKSAKAAATLVVGLLLVVALVLVADTGGRVRLLLGAAALGSLPMTVPVLLEASSLSSVYGGAIVANRPVGGFSQPNQLGCYAAIVLLLACGGWLATTRRLERVALAVAAAGALGALVVSMSRGAWLGTAVGCAVLVWMHPRARRPVGWVAAGGVVLALAGVLAFGSSPPVQAVLDRAASVAAPSDNPYDVRPLTWQEAVREFSRSPVLGNGPGTFDVLSGRSPSPLQFYPREHAHNGLLTVAAEMGTAGVLAAVAMVVTLAAAVAARTRRLRAAHRWHDLGLLAGGAAALAALGGHLLVDYPLRNPLLMVTAWATFGLVLAALVVRPPPGERVRTVATYAAGPAPAAVPATIPPPVTVGTPVPPPATVGASLRPPDAGPAAPSTAADAPTPTNGPTSTNGPTTPDGPLATASTVAAPAGHPGDLRRLARSSGVGLAGALTSAVLGFALILLVSRGLGAAGAGAFSVAVAVVMTLTVAGRLGADTALVRTLPRLRALGRDADVRTAVRAALVPVAVVTGLLAAVTWGVAPLVAPPLFGGFPAAEATRLLRVGALAVPLGAVGFVALAATRGLGTVVPLTVVEAIVKPAARLLLVAAALLAGAGVYGATAAWALPALLGAGLAGWVLRRALRRVPTGDGVAPDVRGTRRELWTFAGPRGLAALCEIGGVHLGVVLVSVLVGIAEAGIYTAALRLVLAGSLVLHALRLAVAPQLSRLLAGGDAAAVERLHQVSAVWVVLLSWPPFLAMAVWPSQTLAFFGPEFGRGAFALSLLCGALLVNLFTGNVATVLLMSGRSGTTLAVTVTSLLLGVALTVLLAPAWGLYGAAAGKAASMVFENVAVAVLVRRRVGVRTLCRPLAWAAGLAWACFTAPGLLLRTLGVVPPGADGVPAVVAVVAACAAVYAAAVWRLRGPFELDALAAVVPTGLAARLRRAPGRPGRRQVPAQQQAEGDA